MVAQQNLVLAPLWLVKEDVTLLKAFDLVALGRDSKFGQLLAVLLGIPTYLKVCAALQPIPGSAITGGDVCLVGCLDLLLDNVIDPFWL